MSRLAVIGLDGASYPFIVRHLPQLPTLGSLMRKHYAGVLYCDVQPIHSGPLWATIFGGDDLGLTDFARGKDAQRIAAWDGWLWSGLEREAVVLGVPVTLPPISVNVEDRGWLAPTLSVTLDEMKESTWRRCAQTMTALRIPDVTFLVSVWPAPDRAGHVFGMEARETLEVYQEVDNQVAKLLWVLEEWNWVILSDHGVHSNKDVQYPGQETLWDGRKGWHSPEGIVISSVADAPYQVTEVYGWLQDILYGKKELPA